MERELKERKLELMRLEKQKLEIQLAKAKREKEIMEQVRVQDFSSHFFLGNAVLSSSLSSLSLPFFFFLLLN